MTCMSGYSVSSNGNCTSVCNSPYCLVCHSDNSAACTTCRSGYYANLTSLLCEPCNNAPQCMSCLSTNPEICSECMVGFYLTSDSKCVACPSYCTSCFNNVSCLSLLNSNGQVLVMINGTEYLGICDQGCKTCSNVNPSTCAVCYDGYYLVPADNILVAHCKAC